MLLKWSKALTILGVIFAVASILLFATNLPETGAVLLAVTAIPLFVLGGVVRTWAQKFKKGASTDCIPEDKQFL
jgi:hypothetical protein